MRLILLFLHFFNVNVFSSDLVLEDPPVRVSSQRGEHIFYVTDVKVRNCIQDRFYHWYSGKDVHRMQGGYAGKLLSGKYERRGNNGNVLEQGYFRKGLKHGIWTTWFEDGRLKERAEWRKGIQCGIMEVYAREGGLLFRLTYKGGKLDGKCTWFNGMSEVDHCSYVRGVEKQYERKRLLSWQ